MSLIFKPLVISFSAFLITDALLVNVALVVGAFLWDNYCMTLVDDQDFAVSECGSSMPRHLMILYIGMMTLGAFIAHVGSALMHHRSLVPRIVPPLSERNGVHIQRAFAAAAVTVILATTYSSGIQQPSTIARSRYPSGILVAVPNAFLVLFIAELVEYYTREANTPATSLLDRIYSLGDSVNVLAATGIAFIALTDLIILVPRSGMGMFATFALPVLVVLVVTEQMDRRRYATTTTTATAAVDETRRKVH
jgi:hypothetical protein